MHAHVTVQVQSRCRAGAEQEVQSCRGADQVQRWWCRGGAEVLQRRWCRGVVLGWCRGGHAEVVQRCYRGGAGAEVRW